MKFKRATAAIALLWFAIAHHFAGAAVTPEEAAQLQSELTPLGDEKAGNKEGLNRYADSQSKLVGGFESSRKPATNPLNGGHD